MSIQHQTQQSNDVAPFWLRHKTLLLIVSITALFCGVPDTLLVPGVFPATPTEAIPKPATSTRTITKNEHAETEPSFSIQALLELWFADREVSPYLRAWINENPGSVAFALLEHHSIPKPLTDLFIHTLAEQSPDSAAQYFFGEFADCLSTEDKLIAINLIYPQRPLLAARILANGGLGNISGATVKEFLQQAFSQHFPSAEVMFLAEPELLSIGSLKNLYLRSLMAFDLASAFNMLDDFRQTARGDEYAEISSTFIQDAKSHHHLTGNDLLMAIQRVADNDNAQLSLIRENLPDLLESDTALVSQVLDGLPLTEIENRYVEGVLIETEWFTQKINEEGPAFFLRYFNNDINVNLAWQKYILGILSHDYQQAIATLETMPAGQGRDAIIEHILMEDKNQYDRVFADLSYLISNDFERGILGNIY